MNEECASETECDPPRSEKEAAVRQWKQAVAELGDGNEHKELFESADIHDWDDRAEIGERIDFELSSEEGLPLADAFQDLKRAFEGWS